MRDHHVLHEVDNGVDLPAGHGIVMVVAETDAEHADNCAGLAHLETIFFPNGHGAEGKETRGLQFAECGHFCTSIFVLEVSVCKHHADTFSTTAEIEVIEFAWHIDFIYFIYYVNYRWS